MSMANDLPVKLAGFDFVEAMRRLEQRVATLERASRTDLSPVSVGGISIPDPSSGALLPFSQLAFGMETAIEPAAINYAATSAYAADDPALTVTVETDRLIVYASAYMKVTGDTSRLFYSWGMEVGESVGVPDDDIALHLGIKGSATDYVEGFFSRMYVYTMLTPGEYTIRPYYRFSTAAGSGVISDRELTLVPF